MHALSDLEPLLGTLGESTHVEDNILKLNHGSFSSWCVVYREIFFDESYNAIRVEEGLLVSKKDHSIRWWVHD